MKIIRLPLLLLSIFLSSAATLWAQNRQERTTDQSLEPTPIVWYEGKTPVTVFWSRNEIAIFPRRPSNAARLPVLLPLFAGDAQVIEEDSAVWVLRSRNLLSRDQLTDKTTILRNQDGVEHVGPVFYTNLQKEFDTVRIPTGKLIVRYQDNATEAAMEQLERQFSLVRSQSLSFAKGYLYQIGDTWETIRIANVLTTSSLVVYAYPDCWRKVRTRQSDATPNDPLYAQQWHLKNTGQGGGTPKADVALGELETVWESYRGQDRVIAVVDGGVEIGHEDLAPNVIEGRSYNYVDGTNDPTRGSHGTSCAGCAVARGFNEIGVSGTAPYARLIGYALLGNNTDANSADALYTRNSDIVEISSNSWGPADSKGILAAPGPLAMDALATGVTQGRSGRGIIYLWAGGNGGDKDNSNYDGYANSRYTIGVAACDFNGKRASYSEKGANIVVASPSQGDSKTPGIVTTDRTGAAGYDPGNYTFTFNGTSAATPIVSGCIALLLQSKLDLSWRDVQHILIRTADKTDPDDADWTTNAAGLAIDHKYGFGRINIQRAIQLARTWGTVPEAICVEAGASPNLPIPDKNTTGVESSVEIPQNLYIEHVEVVFSANDHTFWPDIQVELISPAGTKSILAEAINITPNTKAYDQWRFMSVRHWGERSAGTWKLIVKDLASPDTGTFQSWTLQIYGTKTVPYTPTLRYHPGCGTTGIEFLLFLGALALIRHYRRRK